MALNTGRDVGGAPDCGEEAAMAVSLASIEPLFLTEVLAKASPGVAGPVGPV